jgi:hypothetical protein
MSLAINPATVGRVLLADGWHDVRQIEGRSTFALDAYEYVEGEFKLLSEADAERVGICPSGFRFEDNVTGWTIAGPLTSVVAVANLPGTGS